MANYKELFMQYMDQEGVKYTDVKEHLVRVTYQGRNLSSIPVYVSFDKDGDPIISVRCWDIMRFSAHTVATGYEQCNEMNARCRWAKFYLDEDHDVIAELDAYIDEVTCGSKCLSLVRHMVSIVDKALPLHGHRYLDMTWI